MKYSGKFRKAAQPAASGQRRQSRATRTQAASKPRRRVVLGHRTPPAPEKLFQLGAPPDSS
eukprot:scaffold281743_cov35-Tisochrysis_lutea.AAC.1